MKKQTYHGLDFNREELSQAMREGYNELFEFMVSPAFVVMFEELMNLPSERRPAFVLDVLLNPEELARRDIIVPQGILIQTSAFGDRRPTLFVLKKFLPDKFHHAWENVNWTFNNEFAEADVPMDPESSWRLPLSVSVQNALMTKGIDLQSVPDNDNVLSQVLE